MKKTLQTTILTLSGALALLFLGNFLVHLFLYLIDGSMAKFAKPVWIVLNGTMLLMSVVFMLVMRREKA